MILSSPLFLLGLLALAVPIAVHLFNFRRYRKIYFSNVDYLEQLQSETRRQSRLRQLLILAARMLAIVFLVLAFTRPVIPAKEQQLRSGGSDVSIYLDNSFSMESTDGNVALLEKARNKAREIVAAFGPTDRFQLMTNDAEGRQFHWLTKEEVLNEIDRVERSSSSPSLATSAKRQFDFLHRGSGANKFAFLVSDFQASMADFHDFPTDSVVKATLVPLASSDQDNLFIDTLAFNAPVFNVGSSVAVDVTLRNDGNEDLEKVPVTLFVNGHQRALATADVAAGDVTTLTMHFAIDAPGISEGYVEINDYPITFDDRYYFSLNVRQHINMLVVEGASSNEFLQRLFADDSLIVYRSMSMQQMDFSRLDGNDFVLLDELPSFSSGIAQSLHAFVTSGGTAAVVLPDHADLASYNEALALFSAPRLQGWNSSRVMASTVNVDHPLYRNVFTTASQTMEMPAVTGYNRLGADAATIKESVIALNSGDEYITATSCGAGRLYLIASPLRDSHTDFVRQALFVPTLYNMALYSIAPSLPAVSLSHQQPVPLMGDYTNPSGNVRLVAADGSYDEIPDLRNNPSGSFLVPHGSVHQAGNYRIMVADTPTEGIAFNYSRLESEMHFLGSEAVAKMVDDFHLDHCGVVKNIDKPLDTYLKQQMEGRPLWRYCILLALAMLLAEIILIRYPSKKKSTQ